MVPKGLAKEVSRVLIIFFLVAGSIASIYIAAGVWGWVG
jgi:hypothetical protein